MKLTKEIACYITNCIIKRVWRYQRGNHNPYIKEEQTTEWQKEIGQKDKQRSTKHIYKIKDRVTWTPPKTWGELRCSGRFSSSYSPNNPISTIFLYVGITLYSNTLSGNIYTHISLYNLMSLIKIACHDMAEILSKVGWNSR